MKFTLAPPAIPAICCYRHTLSPGTNHELSVVSSMGSSRSLTPTLSLPRRRREHPPTGRGTPAPLERLQRQVRRWVFLVHLRGRMRGPSLSFGRSWLCRSPRSASPTASNAVSSAAQPKLALLLRQQRLSRSCRRLRKLHASCVMASHILLQAEFNVSAVSRTGSS